MKEIIVRTQKELDAIDVNFNGVIKIEGVHIKVEKQYRGCVEAIGQSRVIVINNASVILRDDSAGYIYDKSHAEARDNSFVYAFDESNVKAFGHSSVFATKHSTVVAKDYSSIKAIDYSNVIAMGNSTVFARYASNIEAFENSVVIAKDRSKTEARDASTVSAWCSSLVEAYDETTIEAHDQSVVRIFCTVKKLTCYGYSVVIKPSGLHIEFKKEKTVLVHNYTTQKFLERNGIKSKNGYVILYKRVSKDFLTQENTENQTSWKIGSTVTHPNWAPTSGECGWGKYHACSRPYLCDIFRNTPGDRYIAIKIKVKDLCEWCNPQYPHKVAFREGTVLYEVDRYGNKIE